MTGDVGVAAPILAIELSQRRGGVAIVDPARRVHSIEVAGGRRDRDDLAPAVAAVLAAAGLDASCLLYTSPSPRDGLLSRMPSSA